MSLIIVESPSKINKITTYANANGGNYTTAATVGHLLDLVKSRMAIDTTTFAVETDIISGKDKQVRQLRLASKKANRIILAGDPDREGEAICVQVAKLLKLPLESTPRIRFNEITKNAIQNALMHPSTIDMDLYNAQQARRIIDRLLGYTLSPILSEAIGHKGMSAGRVQSVVLNMICQKKNMVDNFESTIGVQMQGTFIHSNSELCAKLNKKIDWDLAEQLMTAAKKSTFIADEPSSKRVQRHAPLPFTTSTMQQSAQSICHFSLKQTMQLAQKLYQAGKITYIRTDKAVISPDFLPQINQYITDEYGKKYLKSNLTTKTSKKKKAVKAQEAHEAIRPTKISDLGNDIENIQEKRLYELIWKRTVASCMASAEIDIYKLNINVSGWQTKEWNKYMLEATTETIIFPGYMIVLQPTKCQSKDTSINKICKGDELTLQTLSSSQYHTEPPPLYSEATIVSAMEKSGIGRPSTYASSLGVLLTRAYIEIKDVKSINKDIKVITLSAKRRLTTSNKKQQWGGQKKKLIPTDIGTRCNTFLQSNFSDIINEAFTAEMETELDAIANGTMAWKDCVKSFYDKLLSIEGLASKIKHNISKKEPTIVGKYRKAEVHLIESKYGKCFVVKNKKPRFVGIPDGFTAEDLTWTQIKFLLEYPHKLPDGKLLKTGRNGRYIEYSSGKKESVPGTETFSLQNL